ncbi:MAG: hypothetical protein ACYS8X_03640 [Planctomycetota bacterium]|jgi:hypothetical protein
MPIYETARGHEEPFSVQFSIFLPNRVGKLKELLTLLAENDIQLLGVSIVDSADWSVVRLITDDPNTAREKLTQRSMPYTESMVLLAVLESDETLAQITELLMRAEINLVFAYPLTIQRNGHSVMAFHVDDDVLASHLLSRHGMMLLGREDLAEPGSS